ncbi:MAG: hypothetical protein QOC77_469 [Thermoleophilaceae bacterium]|nr:hypothetical protein [Thermoleophilaceae bacterium]
MTALPDGGYLIVNQGGPVVRRVHPDGTITTVAGSGTVGYTGDGGSATAASATMNGPTSADMTADGGYLIADSNNNVIRRVAPDGTMSTVVSAPPVGGGAAPAGFGGDGGPATAAKLSFPAGIVVQPDGGYLIADNDNNRIRRVGPDGTISTVAGGGGAGLGDGGPATAATLSGPGGLALTADGGYLITEIDANRVRMVSADATITTVAGTGSAGSTGDGGPATSATLSGPTGVAAEPDGGFLIADEVNNRIRRVAPDGTISTLAGTTSGYTGDGGPPAAAQLKTPFGVAVGPGGDILIADTGNQVVRQIDADPPAPVLTGSAPASPANENFPKIVGTAAPGTTVSLFSNDTCSGMPVGTGTAAAFAQPGIAVLVADNSMTTFHALVTDGNGNNSTCSTSAVTYVESTPPLPPPVEGKVVNAVPEQGKVLVKLPGKGKATGHAAAAGFVPLASVGRQLPVGSTLDTTKGTVRLTSATNSHGGKQTGHFSHGLFTFAQTKKNPLTTISMTGGGLSACSKLPLGGSSKRAAASRKRQRTLFSHVKGHFRTRGRNSAATVRGTIWTMTDTCSGTRTTVKAGTVEVRDFTLRKTIRLRAGHSYLAQAPLRKKPRKH